MGKLSKTTLTLLVSILLISAISLSSCGSKKHAFKAKGATRKGCNCGF